MRWLSASISNPMSILVVGAAIALGSATSAIAQTFPDPGLPVALDAASLSRISADLAFPNSSQRFFEAGNAQIEAEIRQLSDDDEPSEPLLTIRPEALEQFED